MAQIIHKSPAASRDSFYAGVASLLHKYDKRGPRYTSYPPATEFRPLDGADYLSAVQARGAELAGQVESIAPLSLYIHIPFCQAPCFYCGCNKIITRNHSQIREYLDHLRKEMALVRLQMNVYKRPVTQLHWGGGTPTFLDDAEMTELMHQTANYFHLVSQESRDYSIEVDPRTVNRERIDLLRGLGFNRISLGIQDFDETVQKAINREQTLASVEQLVSYVRARAFRSLNFDLIYGLPMQSL
jgi:oxygen-independent coproporphyrinogen-3 oxidase